MTSSSIQNPAVGTCGFAEATVRCHQGVPTLFVDGQPLQGLTATSVSFEDPQVIRDFTDAGTEIMMIWIEAGIHCWKGPGNYDWSYAERRLSLQEAHSGDTRWIIRVRLGLLNHWFKHSYPSEVHNPPTQSDDHGLSVCNIVSPIWRENVERMLHDFVTWLQGTPWCRASSDLCSMPGQPRNG